MAVKVSITCAKPEEGSLFQGFQKSKDNSSPKPCFGEEIVKLVVCNKYIFKVCPHEECQMQALVTLPGFISSSAPIPAKAQAERTSSAIREGNCKTEFQC